MKTTKTILHGASPKGRFLPVLPQRLRPPATAAHPEYPRQSGDRATSPSLPFPSLPCPPQGW